MLADEGRGGKLRLLAQTLASRQRAGNMWCVEALLNLDGGWQGRE